MGDEARFLFGGLLLVCLVSAISGYDGGNIWPMPQSLKHGGETLYLSKNFGLETNGSKYADAFGTLKEAFSRLLDIVKAAHVVDTNLTYYNPSSLLKGLHVVISSASDELQYGIDESYKLLIPSTGSPIYVYLKATTVYGALHGFQTFSQLCHFNFTTRTIEVHQAPWRITDQPRFPYRDTSRHYQPLPMIKNVIDAMAYTKLNVLHWHIVDTQSFPLEIPSYSKLWNGAYSVSERYTMADAAEIVNYAKRRGINVLAELDVPGHAHSWGVGYPSLLPSSGCPEPLDVSKEFTFELIDGILSDFSKVFNFRFVHLGGDEVDTKETPISAVIDYELEKSLLPTVTITRDALRLDEYGMNGTDAYRYFVLRAQKIALSHGYEVVNWEESFKLFGNKLDRKTVVHNWMRGGIAQQVVASGLRCIVSNQDKWYLDHLDTTWQQFYTNEPLENITDSKQQQLVLGGEVCMWGELVDASDIEQTIWPRAAAAAERLWTPYNRLAKDPRQVTERLSRFRCLLNQRGVAAAPLTGQGRGVPEGPGSCYKQ